MKVQPDGLIGAVLAAEGCGLRAMINGPGGCRSRALNLWRELSEEYLGEDPGSCRTEFLSRQSALPCTYLNGDDMVLGSGRKISEGLRSVLAASLGDIMLIDTLASGLQAADEDKSIRDAGAEGRVISAPSELSSMSAAEGYDASAALIAERYAGEGGEGRRPSLTVLGYTMADSSWHFGMQNIRELLSAMGVGEVHFIGCRSSVSDIPASFQSSAVIELHPENSEKTAEVYRKKGVPAIVPKAGSPVGFDAVRSFLEDVSDALDLSPDPALEMVRREEERCLRVLRNCDKDARAFRGQCCAVSGMPSDTLPVMRFLRDWFGLVPGSVRKQYCGPSVYDGEISAFLRECGAEDAAGAEPDPFSTAVFMSDGYEATEYKREHPRCSCMGISAPYARKAEFRDSSLVGLGGCRYILDGIINGRGEFSCGQPTMADFR
ncbi:nitrogenase component 1 [Candidatus Methanomethylophilus sp. 1R26]|uniref:nitrogenase component 1 n=1 Tax=Candidatus Methanomethylophilus sp. 1R26 TaxID=1769296 RepID=UPI0007366440|nr:nitrogenase component 1 [Candidatus Methanomethylophilus sp. 1R26]